ncbi:MAG: UDP-N-acetylglucosamine--N-acetylmuramyl-(pentapeptide) pyrophosphoryl-undecaprenol N-acetylglucosamine transferase [Chloroflexaceae bacterium]|nr:UDP-N-acetylglucosamine--N-acetylmuramyl-(pentapeptide) pyrophosphoryl-undecaprenol N-acetylglucosamine transferase [Chloroflexaceae bacterium]
MERAIVERESNLPFLGLPAAAIRGRNPITLTHNSVTIAAGALAARGLLRQLRPAALLGTGGYVCVPVFLAARSLGIPSIIYLPDVVPGMAVWMLARVATQVACTTITSRPHLEQPVGRLDVVETGYPVRKGLFDQDRASCRAAFGIDDDLPVLLVYGGSRGARSINQAIKALLPDLLPLCRIIHVCGREGDEDWLHEAAAALDAPLQARYQLYPYLESGHPLGDRVDQPERTMVRALVAADIAVCRSGASILAELPAAGLASVLVPYPYVHQDENADYLVEHGAAVKVADHAMLPSDGSPRDGSLFAAIHHLIIHKTERQHMTERSRALARPDAAERLANALLALARRNEGW